MKIKIKKMAYEEVLAIKRPKREKPIRQSRILRFLIGILSFFELKKVKFKYTTNGMEKLGKKEPCLILMNHSSFIDLKIACKIFKKRRFNIVCTEDGFIGKKLLMRFLGCIPTIKFYTDSALVKDMVYVSKKLNQSILMFPEAGYTFDGTTTTLPDNLGKCLKLLKMPLVIVVTNGAFTRNPLYNNLQLRKVNVSADVTYALSPEEIQSKSIDELNKLVNDFFSFDQFKWQQENNIKISEKFRADGLNRILYKCPHCLKEGVMLGKGETIVCSHCKKEYLLTDTGYLECLNGETKFNHIPDWYKWQRECVKQEVIAGTYKTDVDVDIHMLIDTKCLYSVGKGRLVHTHEGIKLTGCDGKLEFYQKPNESYNLNSDFYWYEIADMICVGDDKARYCCFVEENKVIVAKARMAQEEIYKLYK